MFCCSAWHLNLNVNATSEYPSSHLSFLETVGLEGQLLGFCKSADRKSGLWHITVAHVGSQTRNLSSQYPGCRSTSFCLKGFIQPPDILLRLEESWMNDENSSSGVCKACIRVSSTLATRLPWCTRCHAPTQLPLWQGIAPQSPQASAAL